MMKIEGSCWIAALLLVVCTCGIRGSVLVDDAIYTNLRQHGSTTAVLHFKGPSTAQILRKYREELKAHEQEGASHGQKDVPDLLKANALKRQRETLIHLNQRHTFGATSVVRFTQLWILNQIVVHNLDSKLLEQLTKSREIKKIEADTEYQLLYPEFRLQQEARSDASTVTNKLPIHPRPWGIDAVGAPRFWERGYSGEGVTVGVIDTGVRASHRTLHTKFRSALGWFDAVSGKIFPYDDNSHGTHCTGTILGSDRIGVAPNATFIACKGIKANGRGSVTNLQICGQFMLCPTTPDGRNEDCSKRPKIVNNSWTLVGGQGLDFYDGIIDAWVSSGMIVIFGNGNSGSRCNTTGYPASSPKVIAVGATDSKSTVISISSRGPAAKLIKPDIVAPGKDIFSASHYSDNSFMPLTGTSMAAPHVAGVAALLLSEDAALTQESFREKVIANARSVTGNNRDCGAADNGSVYPNNVAGYGSIYVS